MFARVSRYQGDAERLRAGFESVSSELEEIDGFSRAYFLADSESGRGVSITLWDTHETLDASAERAHEMRTRASEPAEATVVSVESYEVVLTVDGRTPTP
jgi:heme-degrading monooxygenase HmoA